VFGIYRKSNKWILVHGITIKSFKIIQDNRMELIFSSIWDGGGTYKCNNGNNSNFGNPPFTISSGNADANGYGTLNTQSHQGTMHSILKI
jgi:hypothetical protein